MNDVLNFAFNLDNNLNDINKFPVNERNVIQILLKNNMQKIIKSSSTGLKIINNDKVENQLVVTEIPMENNVNE